MATTAGEVELAIPKLRTGSFFPSLLHPRRRVDKAQMRRDLLWIAPGVVECLNPWKDEEPCPHPGSTPMSSDDVRSG